MISRIEFKTNNKLCVGIDISEYVRIEENVANVTFPKRVELRVVGDSYLKILYTTFDPKLVYKGDTYETIQGWRYLDSQQVNLSEAAAILAMDDMISILARRFWPAIPVIISTAELAYLVNHLRIRNVKNLEHYIPKIRRKIGNRKRGTIRYAIDNMRRGILAPSLVSPLKSSFFSIISELWVCRELIDKGYDVEFNPHDNGPDFYLNGRSIKLEIAKRTEQLNIQEYKWWMDATQKDSEGSSIRVNLRTLVVSLLLLLADKLGEELKQGDIVVMDVSSTLDGLMMLALKLLSRKSNELELDTAINRALELVDKRRQAVVLYSRSREFSSALCIDAEFAMKFINRVKRYPISLISLRKRYPYTTIKMLSDYDHSSLY